MVCSATAEFHQLDGHHAFSGSYEAISTLPPTSHSPSRRSRVTPRESSGRGPARQMLPRGRRALQRRSRCAPGRTATHRSTRCLRPPPDTARDRALSHRWPRLACKARKDAAARAEFDDCRSPESPCAGDLISLTCSLSPLTLCFAPDASHIRSFESAGTSHRRARRRWRPLCDPYPRIDY